MLNIIMKHTSPFVKVINCTNIFLKNGQSKRKKKQFAVANCKIESKTKAKLINHELCSFFLKFMISLNRFFIMRSLRGSAN